MTIFLIMALGTITAQTNLSPISAATAQTFGSFYRGLDAINWNPANLAYQYKTLKQATIQNVSTPEITYRIHIQSTTSIEDSDSVTNHIQDFLYKDSLFVNIQTIEKDDTFSVVINDIINYTTAAFYNRLLNDKGYASTRIDTFSIPFEYVAPMIEYQYEKENNFYLELFNFGAMLSNESVNVNWINTNFLNGGELGKLDDGSKNKIIGVLPNEGLVVNPVINYKFGIRINNFVLQLSPDVYSKFVIPSGLFDMTFFGSEISKPIYLNGRKNQFHVVLPISISYGKQINIQFLNNFVQRSYLGVSAKYLAGIAYFESTFDTFSITPNPDYISIQADIKTRYNLLGSYIKVNPATPRDDSFNINDSNKIPPGSGYAFDLGLIMTINDKLSSSIAITNLLGKITWSDGTIYEHQLKMNSQITMDELREAPESSLYSGIEIDTNITISSFQTNYPSALIIGAEYSLDKIKLASNLKFGFSNEFGSSTIPRLSFGTEARPIQWLSLFGGTAIGGYEKFQWGSGITIRMLLLHFSCAYSEYGGILNSAKGFSISASTSLVF